MAVHININSLYLIFKILHNYILFLYFKPIYHAQFSFQDLIDIQSNTQNYMHIIHIFLEQSYWQLNLAFPI